MSHSGSNLHLIQDDASGYCLCDLDEVRKIWLKYKQDRVQKVIHISPGIGPRYGVNTSTFLCAPQNRKSRLAAAQEVFLVETCRRFYRVTQSDGYLVSELDAVLAMDMECSFVMPEKTWMHDNEDDIIRSACHLLSRLPPSSSELNFTPPSDSQGLTSLEWHERPEATLISTSVICMSLFLAGEDPKQINVSHGFLQFINFLASLLHTVCRIAEEELDNQGWQIVIAFLWSTWQRSVMLYLWCISRFHLLEGFDADNTTPKLALISLPTHLLKLRCNDHMNKADYMCNWAFELLRNDAGSKALDFRTFHQRFNTKFGNINPRCIEGPNGHDGSVCDGSSPLHCRRFVGGRRPDKQIHDTETCACKPMFWDAESYKRVRGARAVCITTSGAGHLKYKNVSTRTLSVSHVWSHGQGGRPEQTEVYGKISGFNTCLHKRYSRIAERFDCDSYWIDSTCIPSDEALRNEAISNINGTFAGSYATIIADKDIMSIDVEGLSSHTSLTKSTLQLRETILATLLVCDWNVRAWTFLESLRGRQKLLLLCKNNLTVDLRETLEIVHAHGSIDISALFVGTQHLWPATLRWGQIAAQYASVPAWIRDGFMLVEDAAGLLSHRHASRPKDEVTIWSLLLSDESHKTAEALWKSRIGKGLNTGFILSSAPRLKGVPGFSWAPSRAAVSAKDEDQELRENRAGPTKLSLPSNAEQFYLAYDSYDTAYGSITDVGFRANWLLHTFPRPRSTPETWSKKSFKKIRNHLEILISNEAQTRKENEKKISNRLELIASTYLKDYAHGALLRPCSYLAENPRLRAPPIYRGIAKGTLLAVCGCEDPNMKSWTWVGVFDWENDVDLPEFAKENILLV